MTSFQTVLAALDRFLTSKSAGEVLHTASNQPFSPERFLFGPGDRLYYLSDGGYSRIGCVQAGSVLFLTSTSLAGPKARWEEAQGLRQALEREIAEYLATCE